MEGTKKKSAKRNQMIGKLLDLKHRIYEAYSNDTYDEVKTDKSWVMKLIEEVRGGVVISGDEMRVANKLWEKYR